MIYEYALEPEMVAKWGDLNHRFFLREFGLETGRLVSRYPKKWARRVWEAFESDSQMDKKRLEELLIRLKETMVKRVNSIWDDTNGGWLENALLEHDRHPFHAILAAKNPKKLTAVLVEDDLSAFPCPNWDNPHGITVRRKASDMATAVKMMLSCCRWVKFVDPYFSKCKRGHKLSLRYFLKTLATERPVGAPELVEMHTKGGGADTLGYLRKFYEEIIPARFQLTIYQWQEKPRGQHLHNRYILTDLGGVSFQHGLDAGVDGETDDITRLDREQYLHRCREYDLEDPAFDPAEPPLKIIGKVGGQK